MAASVHVGECFNSYASQKGSYEHSETTASVEQITHHRKVSLNELQNRMYTIHHVSNDLSISLKGRGGNLCFWLIAVKIV